MRRSARVLLTVLCILLPLCGCGKNDTDTSGVITDMKIPAKDVTEFYYTCENINYGAFYRRYRLYTENGKYFFSHETRERPEDYGPRDGRRRHRFRHNGAFPGGVGGIPRAAERRQGDENQVWKEISSLFLRRAHSLYRQTPPDRSDGVCIC